MADYATVEASFEPAQQRFNLVVACRRSEEIPPQFVPNLKTSDSVVSLVQIVLPSGTCGTCSDV